MVITTNTELERNGADAIHLAKEGTNYVVYLGEAKTYTSSFLSAFENAMKSIVTAYNEHRDELQLYSYAEFLEPDVRELMRKYLSGEIELPVKLVIIISYCIGEAPELTSKDEYHKHYIEHVLNECVSPPFFLQG